MKFTRTLSVILCITIAQAILLTVSTEASSPIKTDGESRSLTSSGLRWQFCEPETVVGPCSLVKTCAAYENILVCAKENIVCTTAAPETKSPEYGGPWNGKVTWRRRWTSDTTFEDAAPQKNIQKCRKECVFKSVEVCVEYKYQNTCKVCVQKFEALQICPKSSTAVYEKGNVQRQNELDWKTSRKWTSSYGEESTTSTSIVLGEFCTYECKLLSETCSVEVFPIQTPRPIQQTPFPEATKSHMAQTPPQTVHRTLPPTPVVTSHEPTVVQTITVPPSRTAVVSTSATALITVVSTLIPVRSPVLSATTVSNISTTSKPTSIATSTTRPTQKPTSTSSPTTTSTSSPTTTSTSSPTTTASCPDGLVYTCLLGDICGCVTTSGSCPGNLVKLCVGDTCVCVEAGTPTPSPSFSQPTSTSTSTSTASSTSVPTCPGGVVYTCLLGGICGCVTTTGSCSGNLAKVCLGDLCVCVQAGTSTSNGTASSGVSEAFFAEPERNSTHSAESAPRATATVTPAVVHPTPSPYIAKMNAMSMTPSSSQASSLSVSTLPVATTATLPPPFTPVITTSTSGGSFLDNVEPGGERNSHSSTLGAVAPAMRTTISPPTFSSLGSTPRPGTGIDAPTTSSSGPDRIIEQTSAIPVSSSSSRAGNLGSGTSDTSSGSNSGTPGSGTSYTGSGSSSGTSGSGTSDNGSGSSSGTSGSGTSGSGGLSSTNNGMNMTAFGRWFYVVPRIQHVQNII